ncbi:hypothetical protein B0H15DRAFT_954738 [Mycena belliarum]|uniref:Uncharacterized protein n=1 Tax=Mycena belliarum TaxID=1033014 RepID=A0AAD6TXY0_9AGAR|nr:hypothetical protein B0H15DRAFT_954738 [Mycena belliae]
MHSVGGGGVVVGIKLLLHAAITSTLVRYLTSSSLERPAPFRRRRRHAHPLGLLALGLVLVLLAFTSGSCSASGCSSCLSSSSPRFRRATQDRAHRVAHLPPAAQSHPHLKTERHPLPAYAYAFWRFVDFPWRRLGRASSWDTGSKEGELAGQPRAAQDEDSSLDSACAPRVLSTVGLTSRSPLPLCLSAFRNARGPRAWTRESATIDFALVFSSTAHVHPAGLSGVPTSACRVRGLSRSFPLPPSDRFARALGSYLGSGFCRPSSDLWKPATRLAGKVPGSARSKRAQAISRPSSESWRCPAFPEHPALLVLDLHRRFGLALDAATGGTGKLQFEMRAPLSNVEPPFSPALRPSSLVSQQERDGGLYAMRHSATPPNNDTFWEDDAYVWRDPLTPAAHRSFPARMTHGSRSGPIARRFLRLDAPDVPCVSPASRVAPWHLRLVHPHATSAHLHSPSTLPVPVRPHLYVSPSSSPSLSSWPPHAACRRRRGRTHLTPGDARRTVHEGAAHE